MVLRKYEGFLIGLASGLAVLGCQGLEGEVSPTSYEYGWTVRIGGSSGESISELLVREGTYTAYGSSGSGQAASETVDSSGEGNLFAVDIDPEGELLRIHRAENSDGDHTPAPKETRWAGPFGGTASIVSGKGAYELFVADVDYVSVPFCLRRFSQGGLQWERCFGPESDYRSVHGQKYGVLARADGGAVAVVTSSSRVAFELIDESSNSRTTLVETGKAEDLRSVALLFNETGQLEQFVPIDASETLAVQVMLEDEEGSLYLGGVVSGESRALATQNPTQSADIFVLKLERTGTIEGARVWGGAGAEQVDQIERLDDGALLVGGVFEGEVDFAPGIEEDWQTSAGMNDVFVTRFQFSKSDDSRLPEPPKCTPTPADSLPTTFDECASWEGSLLDGRFCSVPAIEEEFDPDQYLECRDLGGEWGAVDDHSPDHSGLFRSCWLRFDQYDCSAR